MDVINNCSASIRLFAVDHCDWSLLVAKQKLVQFSLSQRITLYYTVWNVIVVKINSNLAVRRTTLILI